MEEKKYVKQWDERLGTLLVDAYIRVHDKLLETDDNSLLEADANLRILVTYMCNEGFGERQG